MFVGKKDMYTLYSQAEKNTPEQHSEVSDRRAQEDQRRAEWREQKLRRRPISRFRRTTTTRFASELTNRVRNHFLRTFGQSTREFIEGSNTASNVTQFLSMFTHWLSSRCCNAGIRNCESGWRRHHRGAGACDVAYLSNPNRPPTDKERAAVRETLDSEDNSGASTWRGRCLTLRSFCFTRTRWQGLSGPL